MLACDCSYPFRSGLGNIFVTRSGNRHDSPFILNSFLEMSKLYLKITTQGSFALGRLYPFQPRGEESFHIPIHRAFWC